MLHNDLCAVFLENVAVFAVEKLLFQKTEGSSK